MSERENPTPEGEALTRHEEVAEAKTRWAADARAVARKRVETYQVREEVPRDVEDVVFERRPVDAGDSGEVETLPDGSVSIPVFEEELVIEKRAVLKERVIVRKETVTEVETVESELRRERVDVEVEPAPPS